MFLTPGERMSHSILVNSTFKSIVRQHDSDVFFLVTQEDHRKSYRVMPRGFQIHSEPNSPVQFLFGNHVETL